MACTVGCKRNSKGHQESWIGYKVHLDVIDGDLPVPQPRDQRQCA